jgi:hypothetical protein
MPVYINGTKNFSWQECTQSFARQQKAMTAVNGTGDCHYEVPTRPVVF